MSVRLASTSATVSTASRFPVVGGGARTTAAWIKLNANPTNDYTAIVSWGNTSMHQRNTLALSQGRELRFAIFAAAIRANGPDSIPLSVWTHVAAVNRTGIIDGTDLYINGALQASAIILGAGATLNTGGSQEPLSLGNNHADTEIAEIGVWNLALSTSEVLALARGVSPRLVRPGSLTEHIPLIADEPGRNTGPLTRSAGVFTTAHPRRFG